MKFSYQTKVKSKSIWVKALLIVVPIVLIFAVMSLIAVNRWYSNNLQPLISTSSEQIVLVVAPGESAVSIGQNLQEQGIIRNATAFSWYTDRQGVRQSLQAGTYEFSPSQSVSEIVDSLVAGDVSTELITILPGKRLDQIEQSLVDFGFSTQEVISALAKTYNHPILSDKPADASLEGYLFPETYQINKDTNVEEIIEIALDEFESNVSAATIRGIARQNLDFHEAVILASIIQNESSDYPTQQKISQVFQTRLDTGMVLGSDPTFFYAAAITGQEPSTTIDHPYNTRINPGLTPGPISNFNLSALEAVANPTNTDFLFFVSGDNGNTYFSKTFEEHQRLTAQYCVELCRLP